MPRQTQSPTSDNNTRSPRRKNKTASISTCKGLIQKAQSLCQGQNSQAIPHIHKLIKKNRRKLRKCPLYTLQNYLRICKKCDKWNKLKQMVSCQKCEDNYHSSCVDIENTKEYVCQKCMQSDFLTKQCHKCHKSAQSPLVKCKNCVYYFHAKCMKSLQLCFKCQNLRDLKQKQEESTQSLSMQYLIKERSITAVHSNSVKFVYNPIVDTKKIQIYKSSLLSAIKLKNMQYVQQLVNYQIYSNVDYQHSMDFGIQYMSKAQIKMFQAYKRQPIGPYILVQTQYKGIDVIAGQKIPEKTLVGQYIGQVFTHREIVQYQKMNPHDDSLMQLQRGKDSDQTLFIMPNKYTNIGRFLNGVKNPKNANVTSMRLLHNQRPIVLLVTVRDIQQGQSLVYDYNAGNIGNSGSEYDTSGFKDKVK